MSHEIGSNLNKGEFEEYIPNSDQDEYGCDYPETDGNDYESLGDIDGNFTDEINLLN